MPGFDSLAKTQAEHRALSRLREATGVIDGPMERHCLRCRQIAARVAGSRGWVIDGEVLTVAAILHDIGLHPAVATGAAYTADGAALARALLPEFGWGPDRVQRCGDAIDRHHDLRRQLGRGGEVEALRLADLIDLSGGGVRFGLDRRWLRQLFAEVPRRGLYGELAREVGRAVKERPLTLPRIFLRP
ncbi:MAG: HD domain-containing protein [Solirubrobacteraceae bacterium]